MSRTKTINVNGKECVLVFIHDDDGFHDYYAIPEGDPIFNKIQEAYDVQCDASYLSEDVIDEIKYGNFTKISDVYCIMPIENYNDY